MKFTKYINYLGFSVLILVVSLLVLNFSTLGIHVKASQNESVLSEVEVIGEIICLPHKDTSGPHTLECALGIKDSVGNNYALYDPSMSMLDDIVTGETVRLGGNIKPDTQKRYDIKGVIEVTFLIER